MAQSTLNSSDLDKKLNYNYSHRLKDDTTIDIPKEFEKVANSIGLSSKDAGGKITFKGADPIVKSTLPLGAASSISLMLKSVAATKVWRMRGGKGQNLTTEISKCINRLSCLYKMLETLNGYPADNPDMNLAMTMALFKTKDGRFIIPDNNMPKLRDRMQKLLHCTNNLDSLSSAILKWNSDDLEKKATDQGLVMGKVRSLDEFMGESVYQGYLKKVPLVEVEKIGDSKPEPLSKDVKTPLSGIRALGMGHIIAGAGIGRALACHGADVLNIWRLNEFEDDITYVDSHVGMRSTRFDYKTSSGQKELHHLLKGADIFFGNRRNKLMEEINLTAKDAAKIRPGIIYCNTSFSGNRGPWVDRVGYDQVAGCVTGLALLDGTPKAPQLPVINVVNDNLVGWLAAAGIMEALTRRAKEGGSYRVHVSLTRVALWLMSLGIFDKGYVNQIAGKPGKHQELMPDLFTAKTPMGFYQGYTDQVKMSELKEDYHTVLVPRGSSAPVWLVNGKEPNWQPKDPSAHSKPIPIQQIQSKIYQSYQK